MPLASLLIYILMRMCRPPNLYPNTQPPTHLYPNTQYPNYKEPNARVTHHQFAMEPNYLVFPLHSKGLPTLYRNHPQTLRLHRHGAISAIQENDGKIEVTSVELRRSFPKPD